MSIQIAFLILILMVLVGATICVLFYEILSKVFRKWETISAYWAKLDEHRPYLRVLMGILIVALAIFLFGDLAGEWW